MAWLPWHVELCCADRFDYIVETDGCTDAYICPDCDEDFHADLICGAEP